MLAVAAAAAFPCVPCLFRVKFWIIKNYMSPHHRRIIPAMAQQVGRAFMHTMATQLVIPAAHCLDTQHPAEWLCIVS
jgi:hypothetical protein